MNAPEDQNGLREALAREFHEVISGFYTNQGWHLAAFEEKGGAWWRRADILIAGPLAPYLAAEAEITRFKEGMEARWRPMDTAPNDVPIYAKHRPNEHTPHGWIALIRRRAEDPDEGRGCGRDTILHYNGDASLRGFYGCWTGWLWPEELATLSPKEPTHG